MSRQINFLAERRKGLSKVEIQDRKVIRIASIVFGVVFGLFLIVFGIRFYFDRQLFQVREAQKAARASILNDQSIERSFVIFVYKLTALANLTQDKQEKNSALNFFSNLFGPDVFITQMTFLEKEQILSLKIRSDSVFSLRQVFDLMNTDAVRQEFTSVNPSDLTRTSNGDYEMVITAVVKPQPAGASSSANFLPAGSEGTPAVEGQQGPPSDAGVNEAPPETAPTNEANTVPPGTESTNGSTVGVTNTAPAAPGAAP